MTATVPNRLTSTPTPLAPSERNQRHGSEAAAVLEDELRQRVKGEVRFDAVSRVLYSTDASNYQVEPIGVVIPSSIDDVLATIETAYRHRVPLLPRGGGSSLAGQTVGAALVIDFSKALSNLLSIDAEGRTVTVEPGINIDSLNRQLKLWLDVRSGSRVDQSSDGGRGSRKQLDRFALDPLWDDRRQRPIGQGGVGKWLPAPAWADVARGDGGSGGNGRCQRSSLRAVTGVS